MSRRLFHRDSRGAALVAVIVAMLFLGIIAAIVISVTRSNLFSSQSGKRSKDNFYGGAERVLDEFQTKLKYAADTAYEKAYEDWLKNYIKLYANLGTDDQKIEFRKLFNDYFLEDTFVQKYIFIDIDDLSLPPLADNLADLSLVTRPTIEDPGDGDIRITNITVTQSDGTDITTISTDLVFSVLPPEIKMGTQTGIDADVSQFSLITDGTVLFKGGNASVFGSIYGGGGAKKEDGTRDYTAAGILATHTSNVSLSSGEIISRSRIETNDKSVLNIHGRYGTTDLASLWVKNILMSQGDTKTYSKMNITGKCYVSDDLTIDADGCTFTMVGNSSEYIGYSASSDAEDASLNSSILINGKDNTLNLYGYDALANKNYAGKLWLFGKSYVYVPDDWGDPLGKGQSYMQGESISHRALQPAYLLPGDCVAGVNHNPMDGATEFPRIQKADGTIDFSKIVNLDDNSTEMNLSLYLKMDEPVHYAKVTYKNGTHNQELYYLYMNFSTPEKAAEFMQKYTQSDRFKNVTASRLSMAGNLNINIDTSDFVEESDDNKILYKDGDSVNESYKIINTGNVLVCNSGSYELYGKNANFTDEFIISEKTRLSNEFNHLRTTLQHDVSWSDSLDLTDYIVHFELVPDGITVDVPADYKLQGSDSMEQQVYIITVDGNAQIDASGHILDDSENVLYGGSSVKAGIIICKGSFTVAVGAHFCGLIIAKDGIEFPGTAVVENDSVGMKKLLNNYPILYFSGISTEWKAANPYTMEFDNWKKD